MKAPTSIRALLFWFALAIASPFVIISAYILYTNYTAQESDIAQNALLNGVVLLAMIVIAAVLVRWYSNRIERPLNELLQVTNQVAKGDLSTRVNVQGPRELAQLASEFNAMVQELGQSDFALSTSQAKYRLLVDQVHAVIYQVELDGDHRLLFVNSGIQQLIGFSPSECMQQPGIWSERIYPADRERVQAAIARTRATNQPFESEYRVLTRDGQDIWVLEEGQVLAGFEGHARVLQGIIIDLTGQKHLEESLQYKAYLLNHVNDAIVATDEHRKITTWNAAAEKLYGWTAEEAIGRPANEILLSEMDQIQRHRINLMLEQTGESRVRLQQYRKSGEPLWVESTTMTLRNESGDISGYVSVNRDITEQKRAEQDLQHRTTQAEALAQTAARLNAKLDMDAVVQAVADETAQALKVPLTLVFLYDATKRIFQLAAQYGLSKPCADELKGKPFAYPDAVGGDLPPCSRNTIPIATWSNAGVNGMPHLTDILMVPLRQEDELLGLVCAAATEHPHPFSPEESQLLSGIASQAVLAVANARLFGQVRAGRQRMQVLSKRLVEMQETERQAIARELHDEIGQSLTGLGLVLEMTAHSTHNGASPTLTEAQTIVKQLMKQVRDLSLDLRPAMLDDLGLAPALNWQVQRFSSQTGISVDMKLNGLEGKRFPPTVETAAYRIVQEALTNVARHARVDHALVRVWTEENGVGLMVADEGVGFPAESLVGKNQSSGLIGMRERAMLLGGQFVLDSNIGEGTRVNARLPLEGFIERRDRKV